MEEEEKDEARWRNRLDWVTVKRNNESTKEIHKFPMPNKGVCGRTTNDATSKGNGRCREKVIHRNKCKSQIEQNDVAKYLRLPICDRVWIRKRYLHLWQRHNKKWKKEKTKERTILDCVADTVFIALINNQAILLLFHPCCVGGALHLLLSWDCFVFFFFSILPVLLSLRLDASSPPSPLSSGLPVINGWQRSCRSIGLSRSL